MITERNMVFANPQAYRVFPNIGNPYNTGITDTAIYEGYLQVTDTSGTTKSFSNTRIIDFTGFSGIIDIDQYTSIGSVKLGRWDTDKIGITHYEMEIIPNTYYFDNQVHHNFPLHATQYEVVTIGDREISRKEVDLGLMSREEEDWMECNWGSADNEVPLRVYANPNLSHRKGIVYLSEPNHGIEEIPVYIYQDGTAVWSLDQISHASIIDAVPTEGYDSGTNSTELNFSIEYTSDNIEGVSIIPVENIEDFSGDYDWFTISNLGDRGMGRAAFYFDLVVQPNTSTESRSVQVPISWEWYRTEDTPNNVFEGMNHIVGTSYLTITQLGIQEPVYEAPYTPGWSIGFSMTNQGTAANTITNGIEVLQTGADPDHNDSNFFGYTNELYEGETFYSATIQVSGLPEGYTIIGIHGWDGVTITQDGKYTLPEFTWTNPNGYPDGTSIPYQDVPSLRFADGTQADVMFDTPITIVITAVQSMEESINEHMVLWYDIAKQGATNESMATTPTLIDHSGNGHDATCYNFAWSGMSGVGGYEVSNFIEKDTSITPEKGEVISSNLLRINKLNPGGTGIGYWNVGTLTFNIKLRVGGLTNDQTLYMCQYNSNQYNKQQLYNGINELSFDFSTNPNPVNANYTYATFVSDTTTDCDITVELLPQYPNALVSDGVDDYCLVEGLPLLNKEDGYTVIAKREWIGDVNSKSQGFVSKGSGVTWTDGAFYFECVEGGGTSLFNRVFSNNNSKPGNNIVSSFAQENLTYLTTAKYNNSDIVNVGDGVDTDKLVVFRLSTLVPNFYASISLYSLLLFNRDLSIDEIEWVKTNLIESEQ